MKPRRHSTSSVRRKSESEWKDLQPYVPSDDQITDKTLMSREKKLNHVQYERKRRDRINTAIYNVFDEFPDDVKAQKLSKVEIVSTAVEYLKMLLEENDESLQRDLQLSYDNVFDLNSTQ